MEKQPIALWDHLVRNLLPPAKLKGALHDVEMVESFRKEFGSAKDEVQSYLIHESLSKKSEEEVSTFVQRHQAFFIWLSNIVFEYQSGVDNAITIEKIYQLAAADIDAVILFLETSFAGHFNQDAGIPHSMGARLGGDLRPQLERVKKRLGEQEKNQQLVESIYAVLELLLQPGPVELSFRQLKYLKNLVLSLSKWSADLFKESQLPPLIETLIAVRFNDERFLFHVFKAFKDTLADIDSEEEQLTVLKDYYKRISQIVETGDAPFFSERPAPKETVLDWLSQEIYFLENRYPKKENVPGTLSSPKINTSLSVPVLALYVRLLKEAGIITNTNYQELFRAVSATFTTHRKADVAHSHLHSKFYAIEESARRKVFDQLMEMAHLCKRIG